MKPDSCLFQVAFAVLCALIPGLHATPGHAQTADAPVAYENATFITGDGLVLSDGVMLVRAGVIEAVGARGATPVPAGATMVDLQGRTVMPALIDSHAHIGYEAYVGWGAEYYSRENILENLRRYAWYGFGAVFSAGSDPLELARDIEAERLAGTYHGARLLVASGMAPPGQGPNAAFLAHVLAVEARTGQRILRGAATPEQGREAVREIAASGSGFIKIWVDDRGGAQEKMPAEVYRAIADEARQFGIRVLVHQQAAADMPGLISAGVSGFLHGRIGPELDEGMAAAMAERDIFLVPNLGLSELRWERLADDPFLTDLLPLDVVQRIGDAFDARPAAGPAARYEQDLREGMARLQAAEVDIVLGTDAGAVRDHFFGYAGHRELEIFVRLGMTPLQAIHAATGLAAQHLGLTDTGTLAAGKRADFVVLEASPLDDIRHTRRIHAVFLGGVAFDREAFQQAARQAQAGAQSPQ